MILPLFLFLHFLSNQTCKTHSNLQMRLKPNNHKNTKTQHLNQNTKTSLPGPTNQTPNIKTQPNTTINQENPPPIHHLQTPPMAKKSRSTHRLCVVCRPYTLTKTCKKQNNLGVSMFQTPHANGSTPSFPYQRFEINCGFHYFYTTRACGLSLWYIGIGR